MNWDRNDLVERCCGKMNLDEAEEFVSNLDKNDGILFEVQSTIQDDSFDDTYTDSDSDDKTLAVLDTDNEVDDMEVDCSSSDPSKVVADAVAEVVAGGHVSTGLIETGMVITSCRSTQTSLLSLLGSNTDMENEDL